MDKLWLAGSIGSPQALYSVQLSILEDIESKEFIWHPFGNKTRCKDYL
jgi:hypothetical protein